MHAQAIDRAVTQYLAPTDEDYAEFDEYYANSRWHISEWEFSPIPDGHWIWRVADPAHPEIRPVAVRAKLWQDGEISFIVTRMDNGHETFESKEEAFSYAKTVCRIRFGQAVREYKPAWMTMKNRETYAKRYEDDRLQTQASVLLDMLTRHPEILDSYRGEATETV